MSKAFVQKRNLLLQERKKWLMSKFGKEIERAPIVQSNAGTGVSEVELVNEKGDPYTSLRGSTHSGVRTSHNKAENLLGDHMLSYE